MLSDFFFERLAVQVDVASIDGRARLVDLARPLLALLPDSVFRQLMVERLAELAQTDVNRLAGAARETDNLLPIMVACVEQEITLGEICGVLRDVWGEYRPSTWIWRRRPGRRR